MAIVVVQVGQCGNQLGDEFFTQLYTISKGKHQLPSPFFARDGMARCVLVDSEPKVVHGVSARHGHFIRPENVVGGQSGRGNNWGLGYYGVKDPHGDRSCSKGDGSASPQSFVALRRDQRAADSDFLTKSLRAIHLETWRTSDCETFEAIVLLHSLAGGTGSGFASILAEKIRYYFIQPPDEEWATWDEAKEEQARCRDGLDGMLAEKRRAKYLLSIAVAPQRAGELATQSINATLSLHVLHRCADAIILLRNDDVMLSQVSTSSTATSSFSSTIMQQCTTFKEANEVFVVLLLPLFLYGQSFGSVDALVRQAIRPISCDLPSWIDPPKRTNNILSLVPTPQVSYEIWRRCALRCRFYAIHDGKTSLPGCKPTIPWQDILSASALNGVDLHEEERGGPRGRKQRRDASEGRTRGLQRRGRRDDAVHQGKSADEEEKPDDNARAHAEVAVYLPKELLNYYTALKRSPVARLVQSLEGVAVLNQTRELDAILLFPLLRSAALKVKVGAFLHMYEKAGVSTRRIEKSYQELAEFLSESEEP